MHVSQNALFLEYVDALERHPHLEFKAFVALWIAAHSFAETAVTLGFEPEDIPDLLLDGE